MWYKYCVTMYVNEKMRPVETILGIGGEQRRMVERVNSIIMYLIHCKNSYGHSHQDTF
jgi:hypothetical protein